MLRVEDGTKIMLINHLDHFAVEHPDPDFRSPYRTAGNAQTFVSTLLQRQKQTGVIPKGKNKSGQVQIPKIENNAKEKLTLMFWMIL